MFTQSGLDQEIKHIKLPRSAIFRPEVLPYGGDPDELEAAVAIAKPLGYSAVYCSEGAEYRPSVFVFRTNAPVRFH